MKHLFRVGLVVFMLPLTTNKVLANEFMGEVIKIASPNSLLIQLPEGRINFSLLGPDFSNMPTRDCTSNQVAITYCKYLEELLLTKQVGVIVEDVTPNRIQGDITVDGVPLSLKLIREGFYRVDHKHNLSHALIIAEEEARCLYKGIWAKRRGEIEYARSCMER